MIKELTVEGMDNRAGDNPQGVAFGFVYFSDGSRVGYTNNKGVFPGNWYAEEGLPNTRRHADLAVAALREKGWLDEGADVDMCDAARSRWNF